MNRGFTLIVPIYNKINTLQRTIDTIFEYHGRYPFKCLLIDDDSNDGSSEMAMQYDRQYPEIFTYIKILHHGNKTPTHARNLGIKLCETELIGFLDAGDEIRPGFIDRGCEFLEKHPEYSLYGNGSIFHWINDDGEGWYERKKYKKDNVRNFQDYVDAFGGDVHFSANIYRTELVRQLMFTDDYGEDVVFKTKYIYKFAPIYIDNSTCESTIWNEESSDSKPWNLQRTNNFWLIEIMDCVKRDIPEYNYEWYIDESSKEVRYRIH